MADSQAAVTVQDALRAQDLLQAWEDNVFPDVKWPAAVLELRGMLAVLLADVREAAYLEGTVHGRRLAAHVVLDALEAEGLFTTSTRQGEGR